MKDRIYAGTAQALANESNDIDKLLDLIHIMIYNAAVSGEYSVNLAELVSKNLRDRVSKSLMTYSYETEYTECPDFSRFGLEFKDEFLVKWS